MIGTFTKGQQVRVYPHGDPQKSAPGTVIMISGNQRSIAVQFDDKPPFLNVREGFAVAPDILRDPWEGAKVTLLAMRYEHGPWIEVFNQGHYEIE